MVAGKRGNFLRPAKRFKSNPYELHQTGRVKIRRKVKMEDELSDRMKSYEAVEAGRRLMPLLPAIAHIDGRAFRNFTKGMDRPFDAIFLACMVDTTTALVRETRACIGHTRSDEITLAWHSVTIGSQIWFDGRVAKMTSQLAAQATLIFYRLVLARMPQYAERLPTFDARVWNVPNRTEGANVFLWREWHAIKNSMNMAVSTYYRHEELVEKNHQQKQDLLRAKDVNWDDYPAHYKRGAYIRKCMLDMPPLSTVMNREAVIFDEAEPIVDEESNSLCVDAEAGISTDIVETKT